MNLMNLVNFNSIAKAPPLTKEGFGVECKYLRAIGSQLPPILFTEQVEININLCSASEIPHQTTNVL